MRRSWRCWRRWSRRARRCWRAASRTTPRWRRPRPAALWRAARRRRSCPRPRCCRPSSSAVRPARPNAFVRTYAEPRRAVRARHRQKALLCIACCRCACLAPYFRHLCALQQGVKLAPSSTCRLPRCPQSVRRRQRSAQAPLRRRAKSSGDRQRARARADILRDALKPVDQVWLADRFRVAAVRRYARLEAACDDQLPLSARARRPPCPGPCLRTLPGKAVARLWHAWREGHACASSAARGRLPKAVRASAPSRPSRHNMRGWLACLLACRRLRRALRRARGWARQRAATAGAAAGRRRAPLRRPTGGDRARARRRGAAPALFCARARLCLELSKYRRACSGGNGGGRDGRRAARNLAG